MAQTVVAPLRVSFEGAPEVVRKAMIGTAKDRTIIMHAVHYFSEQGDGTDKNPKNAHEKEIFHYVNTDGEGKWHKDEHGNDVVAVGVQSLSKQLTLLVRLGDLVRDGERSGRYKIAPGVEVPTGEEDETDAE